MEKELLQPADPRKVLYISDSAGRSGKTEFVDTMERKYPNRVHLVPIASASQMALNVDDIERRQDKDIVIFDVKRQQRFAREQWHFVQELKD